jgi:HlyD family secretion protein
VKRRWIIVIFALLLVVAAVAYCSRPKPIAVAVAEVDRGLVRSSVANTRAGTINACRRGRLAPASGGQISQLHVRKGDRVEENELLIELWNEDQRAQVELARRDRSAAQARAEEACTAARVARSEAERLRRVREQQLVAEDVAERAAGEAESREAACRVDAAQATLERTRVRAPFAGVVAEINGELGEFVTPSPVGIPTPPSIDLIDTSCLYVTAPIDEVDAPQVRAGMPARISLDAFPGKSFAGHVRRVAPYVLDAEKQARTVEIEAEIDTREGRDALLPGYSADVEVILAERDGVLRVPTQAILEGPAVLVVDERGIARRRPIRTGIGNWELTEVLEGLKDGERIVASIDREGVVDGARVVAGASSD